MLSIVKGIIKTLTSNHINSYLRKDFTYHSCLHNCLSYQQHWHPVLYLSFPSSHPPSRSISKTIILSLDDMTLPCLVYRPKNKLYEISQVGLYKQQISHQVTDDDLPTYTHTHVHTHTHVRAHTHTHTHTYGLSFTLMTKFFISRSVKISLMIFKHSTSGIM